MCCVLIVVVWLRNGVSGTAISQNEDRDGLLIDYMYAMAFRQAHGHGHVILCRIKIV